MTLGEDWREAYIDFIRDQRLPAGMDARSAEAARVMRRSKGFVLVDNKLYQRGARSGVLMKCVTREDGCDILREIHEDVCGNHAASSILVGKAYRASFWWPNSLASNLMSQLTVSSPYRLPGHSLAGALIWLGPSQRHQAVSPMYWLLSTSLPSGSSVSRPKLTPD
jgi:hypothetical protein